MLVLSRKVGETLVIGDDIIVTVLHISGNQVRLGTSAPKNTSIDRGEIRQRKMNEQQQMAGTYTR